MSEIKILLQSTNESVVFLETEKPGVDAVIAEAARWAEKNGFQSMTFWLESGDSRKLFVQVNDEPVLTSWVDAGVFHQGRVHDLEGQLDFVRGEYRRRAAGITNFDR